MISRTAVPPTEEAADDSIPLIEDRDVVLRKIRANAEEKWPDNPAMVEHEIERQEEGCRKFLSYAADDDQDGKIVANARRKWGDNYSMIVHEIERQNAALKRLKSR